MLTEMKEKKKIWILASHTTAPHERPLLFNYVNVVCDPVETKLPPQSGLHTVPSTGSQHQDSAHPGEEEDGESFFLRHITWISLTPWTTGSHENISANTFLPLKHSWAVYYSRREMGKWWCNGLSAHPLSTSFILQVFFGFVHQGVGINEVGNLRHVPRFLFNPEHETLSRHSWSWAIWPVKLRFELRAGIQTLTFKSWLFQRTKPHNVSWMLFKCVHVPYLCCLSRLSHLFLPTTTTSVCYQHKLKTLSMGQSLHLNTLTHRFTVDLILDYYYQQLLYLCPHNNW